MLKKIIIGIVGAEEKSGCTHTALTMANYLKNRNLKVALAECNESGHFNEIREMVGQELVSNCFNYNNIDIYPYVNNYILSGIFSKPYQFVILDFGSYKTCDAVTFSRSDVKIVTCGSRPWETMALNNIFEAIDEETLSQYNFFFKFASGTKQTMKDIISGMGNLKNVYFPEYTENPFVAESFPGVDKIIGDVFNMGEVKQSSKPKEFKPFGRKKEIPTEPVKSILPTNISQLERTESQYITESFASDIEDRRNEQQRTLPSEPIAFDNTEANDATPIAKENQTEPVPPAVASVQENTTMATLLGDDKAETPKESKKEKKNGFKIPLFGTKKNEKNEKNDKKIIEFEENDEIVKNLNYTLSNADKILVASKSLIKDVRNMDDSFECKKMLSILSFRIFQNAFCADIRAGKLHKRTASMDGYPSLVISIDNTDYTCNEDVLDKILGENDKTIISPYEDDYTEI